MLSKITVVGEKHIELNFKYIYQMLKYFSVTKYTVQVICNLNARKMCTHRNLECDMLVTYETHTKLCIHKDMRVLPYMCVYRHIHTTSTITHMCVVTNSKCLYKK